MKKLFIIISIVIVSFTLVIFEIGGRKSIKVCNDVRLEAGKKENYEKVKTSVDLEKEVKILDDLSPLIYKDDDHIIARADIGVRPKLYDVNLKDEKKKEIMLNIEIDRILGTDENVNIFIADNKYIYSLNTDTFRVTKLLSKEEVFDIEEMKIQASFHKQALSKGYFGYFRNYNKNGNGYGVYEILSLKTGKKYNVTKCFEDSVNDFLIAEPYAYYTSKDTVNRLNLNTSEIKTMNVIKGSSVQGVLDDGEIVVAGPKTNEGAGLFKLNFCNSSITKFVEKRKNLERNNLRVMSIDIKKI